ncbi:MAG: PilZ domain-containing protein [Deltaproteobacteria bacterium]|nr:MAG: PilZ domain-containing protein [Deltaproteobacteria bacterium]
MEKDYDGSEKRKFKRIVFSAKDKVMGVFTFPKVSDDLISYKIADISAGGLRFIVFRKDDLQISTGDKFFLQEIKGKTKLDVVADIELEVKWVMDHEMFEHIMIGCEFLNISEAVQTQIDQFVEFEQVDQS